MPAGSDSILIKKNLSVKKTMRKLSLLFLLSLIISTSSLSSAATSFTGQTIDVADGDTITVLNQNNESIKIRLGGVDCPESSQVYGNKAKQFVVSKVSGRILGYNIERISRRHDRYNGNPKK